LEKSIIYKIGFIITFISLFFVSYFVVKYFKWDSIIFLSGLVLLSIFIHVLNNFYFSYKKDKNKFSLLYFHQQEEKDLENFLVRKEIISRVFSYFLSLLIFSILIKLIIF
jgi:hypothetical protein